ncbi:MAG: serine/threonine protein kinase, partial [Candidatus Dormibacteraeota bacterium]|nr:serine/threonine protein kinase [Candidatus Dormibacteraeota bacterium]
GVLHCDVKPANILMLHDGDGILADFGLARLTGSMDDTESGVSSGTPSYMSPEQVNAEKPGPGTDQYALAVIAYQLLCGVLPFTGKTVFQVMTAHVEQEPAPPSSHEPRLPAAADSVILRGLAKSPGDRWDSCAGFVHALLEALRQPAAAAPPPPSQPATSLPGDSSWRPAGWQPEEWSD